ncbi:hypothetical protein BaRGS_00009621, partial [Batillaria attramentaria]
QSPIGIHTAECDHDPSLDDFRLNNFHQVSTSVGVGSLLNFTNNGHAASVRVTGDMSVEGGGLPGRYLTAEFHFHWGSRDDVGSEHAVDGVKYPLEMHVVNYAEKYGTLAKAMEQPDGLAVLGVLFQISEHDNPAFAPLADALQYIHKAGDYQLVDGIRLRSLLPEDTSRYWRYPGSLTTPRCYESVTWTVFNEPQKISRHQVNQLRYLLHEIGHDGVKASGDNTPSNLVDNWRPLQPMHGRRVRRSFAITRSTSSQTTGGTVDQVGAQVPSLPGDPAAAAHDSSRTTQATAAPESKPLGETALQSIPVTYPDTSPMSGTTATTPSIYTGFTSTPPPLSTAAAADMYGLPEASIQQSEAGPRQAVIKQQNPATTHLQYPTTTRRQDLATTHQQDPATTFQLDPTVTHQPDPAINSPQAGANQQQPDAGRPDSGTLQQQLDAVGKQPNSLSQQQAATSLSNSGHADKQQSWTARQDTANTESLGPSASEPSGSDDSGMPPHAVPSFKSLTQMNEADAGRNVVLSGANRAPPSNPAALPRGAQSTSSKQQSVSGGSGSSGSSPVGVSNTFQPRRAPITLSRSQLVELSNRLKQFLAQSPLADRQQQSPQRQLQRAQQSLRASLYDATQAQATDNAAVVTSGAARLRTQSYPVYNMQQAVQQIRPDTVNAARDAPQVFLHRYNGPKGCTSVMQDRCHEPARILIRLYNPNFLAGRTRDIQTDALDVTVVASDSAVTEWWPATAVVVMVLVVYLCRTDWLVIVTVIVSQSCVRCKGFPTLSEGGCFKAHLNFPKEYPNRPPKMKFVSEMWHPNIDPEGNVCISILHEPGDDKYGYEKASERWLPIHTVETILVSVISMLADPNDESPANVDAA